MIAEKRSNVRVREPSSVAEFLTNTWRPLSMIALQSEFMGEKGCLKEYLT